MPNAKKKYKRKPKRKGTMSRYKNLLSRSMGVPSGMAKQQITTLRYCDSVPIVSTLGALGNYNFSANSCHDPDITGTGHSPMGWDQWKALYNHYVVLESKLRVYVVNDAGIQGIVGAYLNDDNTYPYTTATSFIEAKRGAFSVISMNRGPNKLKCSFNAKKFFNIKDVKDNLDRIGGPVTGNPADVAVYNVHFQTIDAATDTCRCVVVIDYVVLFSEPKDQVVSP